MKDTWTNLRCKKSTRTKFNKKRKGTSQDEYLNWLMEFYEANKKSIGELAAELHAKRGGF